MLSTIGNSVLVGTCVWPLSVAIGTTNTFQFDRSAFRARGLLHLLALLPLVVPGIVLGMSIPAFSPRIARGVQDVTGRKPW